MYSLSSNSVFSVNLSKLTTETNSGSPPFKVLLLLGSSGVGKTYVVDIIEKHFPVKVFEINLLNKIIFKIFILGKYSPH